MALPLCRLYRQLSDGQDLCGPPLVEPETDGPVGLTFFRRVRYRVCEEDRGARPGQPFKDFPAGAVIRPAVRDGDHRIPGPQHLQKAGSQRIPVSVVGQSS